MFTHCYHPDTTEPDTGFVDGADGPIPAIIDDDELLAEIGLPPRAVRELLGLAPGAGADG